MATDTKQYRYLDPGFVRDQLDEILAQEITALLDIDSGSAMVSFNLASIACITLILEREREIRQYPEFPPERYTKDSFINELVDIGLEKDNTLEKAVLSVLNKGYISTDRHGFLKAEMPSFMMVGFLDNMFPGMQGMNLVAFVIQINEEVNSGRKDLELAKESFKSTLKSRGVSVSKAKAETKASEMASGGMTLVSQSKEISLKLKKDNLDRLSKLIRSRKKRSLDSAGQLNIKDVFDKGPSKEELEARKAEIRKTEETARKAAELARELAEKEERIKEAEEAAKEAARQLEEIEQRENDLLEARQEAEKAKQKAAELEAREAMMAEREAQLKALEEKLRLEEIEKHRLDKEESENEAESEEVGEDSLSDEDIESQIAAFESNLTMSCPLCKQGEIISKTTEKGKEFFTCTSQGCRFVSWDRPYHIECPLCKNPFLTETVAPTGEKGLKCPRASCSYQQNNLFDPRQNMAQGVFGPSLKKKKMVVRRKRH
ncbi:MAG: DNA topoisomerase I [Desulfobacula sp. GWF2_41_7]|nr:MAG: DNA topoisomerase I [Desulfobacula sp. GWF2_41_7]